MTQDKNTKLMLAAGSKNGAYDPESPDQWRWVLRHGEAQEQAMAWVKSKTTAYRHDAPFCVDEHGKALYIPHMAVELGWEEQTARNYLGQLAKQGRVKFGKGRIWYCADIPQAYQPRAKSRESTAETAEDEGRTEGDESNSIHGYLPPYAADFIETLSGTKKATALAKWKACLTWRREFFANLMASGRDIADRVEDTTLQEIGVPKKRLPKRREPTGGAIQIKLFEEPDFVQSCITEFVQLGDSTEYKPKNEFVDARASSKTAAAAALEAAPSSQPSSSAPPLYKEAPPNGRTVTPPPIVKPSVRRGDWSDKQYRTARLQEYLVGHFAQATPPDDVVLSPLADLVVNQSLLTQFEEASKDFIPKKGWKGFIPIARAVVDHHGDYNKAKTRTAGAGGEAEESPMDRMKRIRGKSNG